MNEAWGQAELCISERVNSRTDDRAIALGTYTATTTAPTSSRGKNQDSVSEKEKQMVYEKRRPVRRRGRIPDLASLHRMITKLAGVDHPPVVGDIRTTMIQIMTEGPRDHDKSIPTVPYEITMREHLQPAEVF